MPAAAGIEIALHHNELENVLIKDHGRSQQAVQGGRKSVPLGRRDD